MAKGIGLIGNFRGKVGNMVGYNLKDSNNKQTQGVRVYQPVVKNPKTYGQAEQRAKLAPINATYRALKAIIDRGQEGKAYGNKSRLPWLSDAMKQFNGAWIEKGAALAFPAIVKLSNGSLPGIEPYQVQSTMVDIRAEVEGTPGSLTVGAISTSLISKYPTLIAGDQVTAVMIRSKNGSLIAVISSIVIDTTSSEVAPSYWDKSSSGLQVKPVLSGQENPRDLAAACLIVSREGSAGEHLRSSATLIASDLEAMAAALTPEAKEAAIKSYMAAGANTDWAEESLQ